MRKRRAPFADVFVLGEHERWWRDRYLFFESHGYRLRSRLHPDWVPSWETSRRKIQPALCEDHIGQQRAALVDATRIADGKMVYLKRVKRNGTEKSIALYLSSEELRNDSENHCVPVYEYFDDLYDESLGFIAMPLLRHFNNPRMIYVNDVIDFIRQTLIGLSFMHRHNIAHRDCSIYNIMLDPSDMYPDGFHPISQNLDPSWKGHAHFRGRHEVTNVKYYFIDFGISTHFTDPGQPRLVLGSDCQDREVPELSNVDPYDPYPVDIFILGNVYRNYFTKGFPSLFFLRPLADAMTSKDAASRPNIKEALELFEKIVEGLPAEEPRKEIFPSPAPLPSIQTRLMKTLNSKSRAVAHGVRAILGNLTAYAIRFGNR